MAAPANRAPRRGKHVVSAAPSGPRDLTPALARQRAGNDARPTVPKGGWPETTGRDPDSPAGIRPSRENSGEALTSAFAGAAPSVGGTWHPRVPGEYAGY